MRSWIRLAGIILLCSAAPCRAEQDSLKAVEFLVGEWSGDGKHPFGTYREIQTVSRELSGSVLSVRTRSKMGERVVFEDLRVISWDPAGKRLRMRQWAEGVLRVYSGVAKAGGSVVFTESAREGKSAERWRYTFTAAGNGSGFDYRLEKDSGEGWKVFVTGALRAETRDPGQAGGMGLRQYDAKVAGMDAQIHHPDGKGPFPVIVFSPGGNAQSFQGYRPYGRWWATWGYVTVIVAFNDASATERAAKFRKAVDWVVAENARDGSPLRGMLETERIAVAGHSRGGNAALRAARADSRVKACLALAPSGPKEPPEGEGTAAACIVIGDKDEFLAAATKAYEQAPGERYLLVVPDMTHMLAPREATLKLVARSTAFLNYALKGDDRYREPLTAPGGGVKIQQARARR